MSEKITISGKLCEFGQMNGNNRIYSREGIKEAFKKFQEQIDEGTALGELGHPDSPVITLKNVSHKILDVKPYNRRLPRKKKKLYKKLGKYEA